MTLRITAARYTQPIDERPDAHVGVEVVVANEGSEDALAIRIIPRAPLAEPAGAGWVTTPFDLPAGATATIRGDVWLPQGVSAAPSSPDFDVRPDSLPTPQF